jgi:hypothetical protein
MSLSQRLIIASCKGPKSLHLIRSLTLVIPKES